MGGLNAADYSAVGLNWFNSKKRVRHHQKLDFFEDRFR